MFQGGKHAIDGRFKTELRKINVDIGFDGGLIGVIYSRESPDFAA